jgi:glutathione peroxidase
MKLFLLLVAFLAMTVSSVRAATLHDITVNDIDGKAVKLEAFRGKVLLIVNVASQCGYTGQYQGLQTAFQKYEAKGFAVLGFPCNQFGGQEPGSNEEIKSFCSANFHVTFPMFDKIEVNGAKRHPLYVQLAGKESPFPGDVKWNFGKFLIGRDGKILARFGSGVELDSAELTKAIEAALAAK